jgi:hypothetical protein
MNCDHLKTSSVSYSETVTKPKKDTEKTLRLVLKSSDKIEASNNSKFNSEWKFFGTFKFSNWKKKENLDSENNLEDGIEKIEKEFSKIQNLITETSEFVKNEMRKMNAQEREQVINFWYTVNDFFQKLLNEMNEWFNSKCLEIKSGKKVDKKALDQTLNEINNNIFQLFNKQQLLPVEQSNEVNKKEDQESLIF